MNRWLALLVAIVGGAVLGYIVVLAVAGAILGILWLYVFGDDPWPAWSDYVVGGAIVAGGLAAWAFFSWMIWRHLAKGTPTGHSD